MTELRRLMKEAKDAATWRGHTVGRWKFGKDWAELTCKTCGAWVQVQTNPPPNGIDIGGPAVAINCGDDVS
jgi:hypothetical protein